MTLWTPWKKMLPLEWRDLTVSQDMTPQSYNLFAYVPADILGVINLFLTSVDRFAFNQVALPSERVAMRFSLPQKEALETHFQAFPLVDAPLRAQILLASAKASSLTRDVAYLRLYHMLDEMGPEEKERINALIVALGWKPGTKGAWLAAQWKFVELCEFVMEHPILINHDPSYAAAMSKDIMEHQGRLDRTMIYRSRYTYEMACRMLLQTPFLREIPSPVSHTFIPWTESFDAALYEIRIA